MTDDRGFNRIQLDRGVTNRLQRLKGDTGLTPNYLVRIGFCYSLNEPRPPSPTEYDSAGQVFNRYTLLGEHDPVYIALLQERMIQDGLDPDDQLYEQLTAHMNRGANQLAGRVRDLTDFYAIIPRELKSNE